VDDQDKFDVIAGAAALVMPSYYESLSMVALEAWALGTPVVANARCDVLLGQCLRSNAGLYYANGAEFGAVLDRVLDDRALAERLGRNGRQFYEQNYSWPVIERKYLDMFAQLSSNPPSHRMEKLPGWLARRQRSIRPAGEVLEELPSGAAA
jgi:glycosyltransferase involved in cell wall biosynthesis